MEIDDIKLKDILSRTQLTVNPKKIHVTAAKKSLVIDTSRVKQEPPTYGKFQAVKITNKRINALERPIKSETPSETDEEDWIKANIIKVEPHSKVARPTKIKTIYPQHQGNLIVNRKRPSVENNMQVRAGGKKIIIDAGGVMKSSFVNKNNPKRIVISSRPTIVMDPNDLIDDEGANDAANSPESRHEVQACFLSLIRDIFCSTRDHRMKLEELRNRINVWLSNPIASANDWFMQANDWGALLISAVHFLSGEFQDQPEEYVPYLEFKSQLNIYQWIGAGRDSDTRMMPLCQYWLSRRNEMGVKLKYKTLAKTFISPEKNEENHLQQALSPPNARCRTDWKVQPASEDEVHEFRMQERQRYESPHLPFTYRQHAYESVVGPLRGIYSQSPAASKARDHNTLIADRPNFVTILALVRDAAARLPNGEGTRYDICELLKSSQYIIPGTTDNVIQSIVSGALDRMHTEPDPCIKYDTKRKLWIYVHRNRTEGDFERLHQQQSMNRQKKPVFRKTKLLDAQQLITISSPMRVVSAPNSTVRTYQTKVTATTSKPVPALTTFEQKQKIQNQSSPPPLKISPKRYVKTIGNEKSMEPIDVEASLDAQAIVKSADPKQRMTLKNVPHMSPIRIVTSSPNYVQSSSGTQSIIINANRSQSPKVNTIVGTKKLTGKPVIITQSQAPPLVSQSSPNTGHSYLIPINMKQGLEPPSLTVPKTTMLQHKNMIKLSPSAGKHVISPQQKIILTSASAKGGKIMTIPKSQSPVTMLSQQKQILTNVIVQQQKAKGQNQIIMNTQQKMPGLTISSPGGNSPQVIQIQQTSADGKMTLSSANLTPQQRQTIFQSLKQFKQGGNQQTMIVKPQIVKSSANEIPAPPLVSVSGNVGKIMKSGTTTMIQQPQVIVSMAQKTGTEVSGSPIVARVVSAAGRQLIDGILPKAGTTFKIAGTQNTAGQSNLIQISGAPGSHVAQYTVVSKGKNIISVNNQGKLITTQANISSGSSQGIVTSTGNVMLTNSQQNIQTSQPIKIVQGGSITAQQLMGAKLINVQSLANKGIKTTGAIK
jgi:nuclear factor related to kappa-B-binding protein